MRGLRAAGLAGLALLLLATASARAEPSPAPDAQDAPLTPRLSTASAAMEYWDVTAWLDSGERFVARFLVTNEGPGVRTAAAVGYLVPAAGAPVPFKWGRQRDDWKLAPNGERLKIGKATLELAPAAPLAVEIASAKHGVQIRLEIARAEPPRRVTAFGDGYPLVVVMPTPVRGRVQFGAMTAPRAVTGTAAVTHAWMERSESEQLRRRVELFARDGALSVYGSALTLKDGTTRAELIASRASRLVTGTDATTFTFGTATTAAGDADYPLPTMWTVTAGGLATQLTVERELLRMNPLDVLPQPFRMLAALAGRPQRVWADARLTLALPAPDTAGKIEHRTTRGMVAATFARPVE